MEDAPEQQVLFYIEGPNRDGCVYICSSESGQLVP